MSGLASRLLDAALEDGDMRGPLSGMSPSPAICSETNRQAAEEWLDKARKRHEAGDDAAALRFCEKSLRLHEGNEAAAQLAAHLRKFGAGTPTAEAAARVLKLGPKEHAAVLQLSATQAASAYAVRAAYRKLALLLHPDKNQARQAEAAFKRLQAAYEALSAQASGTGGGGGPSTKPSGGSSGGSSRGEYSDDECFCTQCGEYCKYGEELCEECAAADTSIPSKVRKWVEQLRSGGDRQKEEAARELYYLAHNADNKVAIARAGGIAPLVALARDGTDGQKGWAASALRILALNADNQVAIARAGGIPPLVALARGGTDGQKERAAAALASLALNADNQVAIARAGGIPPLVALARGGTYCQKMEAARALGNLGCTKSMFGWKIPKSLS